MDEYSQKWQNGTSRTKSTKTSDGLAAIQAHLKHLGREIKKVNEKVYAAQVGCEQSKGPHYTKDCPRHSLGNEGKASKKLTTPQFRNNANPSYQEQRQSMEGTLSKVMSESAKRHEDNSNLIKEIRASTDAVIRKQGTSIKTLKIQIRQMSKIDCEYPKGIDENVLVDLRRDQVDDLMPTIEEGKVVEEFRVRNDARMDKLEYKGNNVVGALMNIPIFVGTFSILMDFAVLEDMDAYRDERMGDVIFGEPFLRKIRINAKRFKGMITIHNGNEEVTYQMVRYHPRFKHHTNEQRNKIPPLLNVSEEDTMNEISHTYQKLKSFYKGVLNLGPEYVQDAEMEEWLIRGHISVHEME
ncbi:hypothetical protein Tco_0865609 [Tanacetum coccineum]